MEWKYGIKEPRLFVSLHKLTKPFRNCPFDLVGSLNFASFLITQSV